MVVLTAPRDRESGVRRSSGHVFVPGGVDAVTGHILGRTGRTHRDDALDETG